MGRPKAAENCKILPWLSANHPPSDKRFIQIGNSLLLSKKYQALHDTSRTLYECLAMESGGKRFVKLSRRQAEKKYGIKEATYTRAKKELIEKGFIRIKDNTGRYETNCFEFIDDWKNKNPVSD